MQKYPFVMYHFMYVLDRIKLLNISYTVYYTSYELLTKVNRQTSVRF